MIIVTGGAGFIGSNIIQTLNQQGRKDILVVDNLKDGVKFRNLVDCEILDYADKTDFMQRIRSEARFSAPIDAVFHLGACSSTTEWDGQYIMRNNYEYSKELLHYCLARRIPLVYASSASVYGDGAKGFRETLSAESPLNMYGYSKFQFDQYVRHHWEKQDRSSQIVGLRYFNVYGPREQHKGSMASVAFHFHHQLLASDRVKLFESTDGYADGEQRRDFIYVGDAAQATVWFMRNPAVSGIFNVGTGRSQTFNDVARAVLAWHGRGEIEYIPFPEHLKGRYQSYTQADIQALRDAGYDQPFMSVEQGVRAYLDWLTH